MKHCSTWPKQRTPRSTGVRNARRPKCQVSGMLGVLNARRWSSRCRVDGDEGGIARGEAYQIDDADNKRSFRPSHPGLSPAPAALVGVGGARGVQGRAQLKGYCCVISVPGNDLAACGIPNVIVPGCITAVRCSASWGRRRYTWR